MPRIYKPTMKPYTEMSLDLALSEIEAGESIRATAVKYNVSRSILMKRIAVKAGTAVLQARGRKPILSQTVEDCLGVCIRKMEQLGFGPTLEEMRQIVRDYVVKNEIETIWGEELPGKEWCAHFMKRQRLSLKKSGLMQIARMNVTSDPYVIYGFYDILKAEVDRLGIGNRPECFWNCDESGFPDDPSVCKSVGAIGAKTVRVTCGNNRSNTTVLAVCSAAGKAMDPLIIFKGAKMWNVWKGQAALPDTWYGHSENGWMTTPVFHEWFTRFVEVTKSTRPLLLLFDGHLTHMSIPTILLAMEENISLLKLPAHCTDTMQPLDVCVFSPLKRCYEAELTEHVASTGARDPLSKSMFVDMICKIWPKGMTEANIKSGFEATGIYPVNSWKYKIARLDSVKLKSYNWWKSNGSQLNAEGEPDFTGYLPSRRKEPRESFSEDGIRANSTRLDEAITSSPASGSASAANVSAIQPASISATGSSAPGSATATASATAGSATVSGVNAGIYKELQKQAPPGMRYVLTLEPADTEVSFEAIIKSRGKPSAKTAPAKRKKMSMHGQIITEPEFAEQLMQKAAEQKEKEKKKQEREEAKKKQMTKKKTTKKPVQKVKSKAKPAQFSSGSSSDSDVEFPEQKNPMIMKPVQFSSGISSDSDANSYDDNHVGDSDGPEECDEPRPSATGKTLTAMMKQCRASLDDHSGN